MGFGLGSRGTTDPVPVLDVDADGIDLVVFSLNAGSVPKIKNHHFKISNKGQRSI